MFRLLPLEESPVTTQELHDLYTEAFPPEEQEPFDITFGSDFHDMFALYDDGVFVGFALCQADNDLVYLGYFAIRNELRGKGYGSLTLQALQKRYAGKRIFLDMEQVDPAAENYQQRVSRRAFYTRNGFTEPGILHDWDDMVYEVLVWGGTLTCEEASAAFARAGYEETNFYPKD